MAAQAGAARRAAYALLRASPSPACHCCTAGTARIAAICDTPDARRLRDPAAQRTLRLRPAVFRFAQPHASPSRTGERQAATARLRRSWPPPRLAGRRRPLNSNRRWMAAGRTAQHDDHRNGETDRESVQERNQDEHLGIHRVAIPSPRPSRDAPPSTKGSIVLPGPTHRSTRERTTAERDKPHRGPCARERRRSRAGPAMLKRLRGGPNHALRAAQATGPASPEAQAIPRLHNSAIA